MQFIPLGYVSVERRSKDNFRSTCAIAIIVVLMGMFSFVDCKKPQDPEFLGNRQTQFQKFKTNHEARVAMGTFKPVGIFAWEGWK